MRVLIERGRLKSAKNFAVRGHKFDHLALNSTNAVTAEAGFTLASPATEVVEFQANLSNLCPRTIRTTKNFSLLQFAPASCRAFNCI